VLSVEPFAVLDSFEEQDLFVAFVVEPYNVVRESAGNCGLLDVFDSIVDFGPFVVLDY
jgi:hypothetical protein